MSDLAVPTANGALGDSPALQSGQATDRSAAQVERVAQLVTQEAATVRQSGATSLAVSLKVDQNTELFVQLTNHNGQIQASLRVERGSLSGLEAHWGQLQESLARQNVQLLPPAERASFRGQADTSSDSGGANQFEQSAQNEQQPHRNSGAPSAQTEQPVVTVVSRKAKNKNSSGQGWESWA